MAIRLFYFDRFFWHLNRFTVGYGFIRYIQREFRMLSSKRHSSSILGYWI